MGTARARAGHQGVAIRFVVPFGAQGAADRAARACAEASSARLTVENIPGSGGLQGLARANALAGRGDPVLMLGTPTTHILLPARVGIAPHERFCAMLGLGSAPNVLLASPALGVKTVEELVERARRERLVYASAGEGQTIHVCTAFFCKLAGIEMTHRPYDGGSSTAYADFAVGRVHVYFDSLLGCRERIAAGEAAPLAVSSAHRSAALPAVPTLVECGFADHVLDVWLGVFGANMAGPALDVGPHKALHDRLRALGLADGPKEAAAFKAELEASRTAWRMALAAAA